MKESHRSVIFVPQNSKIEQRENGKDATSIVKLEGFDKATNLI